MSTALNCTGSNLRTRAEEMMAGADQSEEDAEPNRNVDIAV